MMWCELSYPNCIALCTVQPSLQIVDKNFDSRRIVPHTDMAVCTTCCCQVTGIGVPRDGSDDI